MCLKLERMTIMLKIPQKGNGFTEAVVEKLNQNTKKIKINLEELVGKEQANEIREVAQKLKDKTNLVDDVFTKS